MKIIARFPVELNDHIYHKGESCDYTGDITPRIAANFTNDDGSSLVADAHGEMTAAPDAGETKRAAIARTIEVMGREGIKRALDAMNAPYSASANTERLARTLLRARGEIED